MTMYDEAMRKTVVYYDQMGRAIRTVTDPMGINIQELASYDLFGQQVSATDGEGNIISYAYDGLGRLERVTQSGAITEYEYDIPGANGTIINRVKKNSAPGLANSAPLMDNISETHLDYAGRKIKDVYKDTAGGNDSEVGYEYNANDQLTRVNRADGSREQYSYDARGQLTRIGYYEANANTEGAYITYSYDAVGTLVEQSTSTGGTPDRTLYVYDNQYRLLQLKQQVGNTASYVVDYGYDANGNVTGFEYQGNQSAAEVSRGKQSKTKIQRYTYDARNRLTGIKLGTVYDKGLTTETAEELHTVRTYDYSEQTGDLVQTSTYRDFLGSTADYIRARHCYDTAGRIHSLAYTDCGLETDTELEQYELTYDDRGYITQQIHTDTQGSWTGTATRMMRSGD